MATLVPKDTNDLLESTSKKLDIFIGESKKHQLRIIDILTTISSDAKNIEVKTKYIEPNNEFVQNKSIVTNKNKDNKTSDSSNAWVPPTGEETIKTKKSDSNKGILSKIWNKLEAKNAYNDRGYSGNKIPFMGALLNGLIAGLSKSAFMQSPYVKFVKFVLSPPGLVLIYFLYKWIKKNVWDPYIKPIITWISEVFWPPIRDALIWIKDVFLKPLQTFLSMFPTGTELKNAFTEVKKTFNDGNATILEKIGSIANLLDTLLAPLTNTIKMGNVASLILEAKALDKMGFIKKAAAFMAEAQTTVLSMHGSDKFKSGQLKNLQESDIGKKYSAAVDQKAWEELVARKDKGDTNFTKQEQAILDTSYDPYKLTTTQKFSKYDNEKLYEEMFARIQKQKPDERRSEVTKEALELFKKSSLNFASTTLGEIRSKGTLDEQNILKYLQMIIDNNTVLSRNAEAQQAVLDVLADAAKTANIKSDELAKKITLVQKNISGTTIINNTLVDKTMKNTRIETPTR
jgi:hypothetical protein